jgi:hypothetical protein
LVQGPLIQSPKSGLRASDILDPGPWTRSNLSRPEPSQLVRPRRADRVSCRVLPYFPENHLGFLGETTCPVPIAPREMGPGVRGCVPSSVTLDVGPWTQPCESVRTGFRPLAVSSPSPPGIQFSFLAGIRSPPDRFLTILSAAPDSLRTRPPCIKAVSSSLTRVGNTSVITDSRVAPSRTRKVRWNLRHKSSDR